MHKRGKIDGNFQVLAGNPRILHTFSSRTHTRLNLAALAVFLHTAWPRKTHLSPQKLTKTRKNPQFWLKSPRTCLL